MQVNFEGLLKGIWRRGATTRFCQQNGGGVVEGLKDQVVLSILAFRFTAIRVTVWEIRLFEGKPAEIANSAGFTFFAKIAEMGESSNSVGIEKLDKDNYQPWRFRMRTYLTGKSLWGYVSGEEKEPKLPVENKTEQDIKAWKAWNEKDKKVMFVISQNMSNSMVGHI